MAYQPLSLPENVSDDVRTLIQYQVEPLIRDIRTMLRLPYRGLGSAGCDLSCTIVMLGIVAGASRKLFEPERTTIVMNGQTCSREDKGAGQDFRGILLKHFPWDVWKSPQDAKAREEWADLLWTVYRNPLSHSFGSIPHNKAGKKNITRAHVAKRQGKGLWENELTKTEKAKKYPFPDPPIIKKEFGPSLFVEGLYWCVRKLIENVSVENVSQSYQITFSQQPHVSNIAPTNILQSPAILKTPTGDHRENG